MAYDEDRIGELLWRYIEERRQSEDAIHFLARTEVDPETLFPLLPLADDVHLLKQADMLDVRGQQTARLTLEQAIAATPEPPAAAPTPEPSASTSGPSIPASLKYYLGGGAALLLLALLVRFVSVAPNGGNVSEGRAPEDAAASAAAIHSVSTLRPPANGVPPNQAGCVSCHKDKIPEGRWNTKK